jgi:hypothetical protein
MMGLKLHSLQSVWTARRLPEGNYLENNYTGPKLSNGAIFDITYSQDPHLNQQIKHLHALARNGGVQNIQQHIDTYLPAVAYLNQNPSHALFARKMVLSISDSPQLGTLPDLCPVIRSMLGENNNGYNSSCNNTSGNNNNNNNNKNWGFILGPLYAALPCVITRRTKSEDNTTLNTHQVALCILLALLLGIYPTSVKFPPFHVRVALYRRIHCLLTDGTGTSFCQKHPALLTLALMEYCAYVIPAYLPVEHELLAADGVEGLFSSCPLTCDAFRQEVLITGEEDWASLEAYCVPIVDRHTRACKSRSLLLLNSSLHTIITPTSTTAKSRQQEQFQSVKLCADAIQHLPLLPIIVPYGIHLDDPTHKIMASEMRFLGLSSPQSLDHLNLLKLEQAVALQRAIRIQPLPANLTQIQIRALSSKVRKCERSAISGSVLYACMQCIMGALGGQQALNRKGKPFPTRGQCKLDLDKSDLICSVCHHQSILPISALGRIISLKNHQFYLAPCCCTVQPYMARGDEFQLQTPCHHKPSRPPSKHTKKRCALCSNVALIEAHEAVDHLTGERHTTYLCQRHTPATP